MVALHGGSATCAQLMPFCRSLDGVATVFAPEGPIPAEGRFGTMGAARDWFVQDEQGAIEPVGFADSLHQVEQFVFDTLDDVRAAGVTEPKLWLLGLGQGGVMALTISTYWPELFAGVVSIDGHLPEIEGWEPPQTDLNRLPVLLIGSGASGEGPGGRTASRLAALHAGVTRRESAGSGMPDASLIPLINEWRSRPRA